MDVADTAARCAQCRHLDQLLRVAVVGEPAMGSGVCGRLWRKAVLLLHVDISCLQTSSCPQPHCGLFLTPCDSGFSPWLRYSCLLPTVWLPSPPCCLCLISCPIPECLCHLRLQPRPPCSEPRLTRLSTAEDCGACVVKGQGKHSSKGEKHGWSSVLSGLRGGPVSWAESKKITQTETERTWLISTITNTSYSQHTLDF